MQIDTAFGDAVTPPPVESIPQVRSQLLSVKCESPSNRPTPSWAPLTSLTFYTQSVEDLQRNAIARLEETMFPNVPKFEK